MSEINWHEELRKWCEAHPTAYRFADYSGSIEYSKMKELLSNIGDVVSDLELRIIQFDEEDE